jgi:multiple antibiotic resistance protein
MTEDFLTFTLFALSSVLIIVNPLGATLVFVSLTSSLERSARDTIARDACRFAIVILLCAALFGSSILHLLDIDLYAFRIAGGILLFGIGMEMVYAKTSRTKLTATEKYESTDMEDTAMMPLAIPMIAGPGAITTSIVLMNQAGTESNIPGLVAIAVVLISIVISIIVTYFMMRNSEYIMKRIGQREFRVINRLMGMLLIAIAVQLVITGIKAGFPVLTGGQ